MVAVLLLAAIFLLAAVCIHRSVLAFHTPYQSGAAHCVTWSKSECKTIGS